MNLGEIGENGKLKIVQNVNELYDIWQDLKKDEKPKRISKMRGKNHKTKNVHM